jgi:hypothetical protein
MTPGFVAPDAQVYLELAYLLLAVRRVGLLDLDRAASSPLGDEARARKCAQRSST